MQARFSDNAFSAAHGRAAKGRGNWAFSFDRSDDAGEWFFFNGLFGEAKREAAAEAKRRGADSFELLS